MAKSTTLHRPAQSAPRTQLYRAVYAAIRSNGMDDDDRKAMMRDMFGKASLSDMSEIEISHLLDRLNRDRNRKAPAGHRAHLGKIRALWWSLYWLGEAESSQERAISAFVKRQTGVSALRFVDYKSASSVIEALKSWATRAGVKWRSADQIAATAAIYPGFDANHADRLAVLSAQGEKLGEVGIPGEVDFGERGQPCALSITHLDMLIQERGQRIRAARG